MRAANFVLVFVLLTGCVSLAPITASFRISNDHPHFEALLKCAGIESFDMVGEIVIKGDKISRAEGEALRDLIEKVNEGDVITESDLAKAGCK